MWVVLVVDMLNKSHDQGRPAAYIQKQLEDLPAGLNELFHGILTRDTEHRDELLLCLQWVLFARRPLSPDELYCAIHVGTDPRLLSEWDHDDDQVELFILNSSKGLTEIIGTETRKRSKKKRKTDEVKTIKTVQFIHESVRDFLLKSGGLETLWPEVRGDFEGQSQDRLERCCMKYIAMDNVEELVRKLVAIPEPVRTLPDQISTHYSLAGWDVDYKIPFLRYATQNVLYHADAAAARGIHQREFLSRFPRSEWVVLHNCFEQYPVRHYSATVTLLYILAENDLPDLIHEHRSSNPGLSGLEVEKERYGTPLFAARATKSDKAALAILQDIAQAHPSIPELQDLCGRFASGTAVIESGRKFCFAENRALSYNAWLEDDDIVTPFLVSLAQVTGDRLDDLVHYDGHERETPLMWATKRGHEAMVRALLTCVSKVKVLPLSDAGDKIISFEKTLLHEAVIRKSEAIIKLLVGHGANLEAKDERGKTPLHWAAEMGSKTGVRALLKAGAQIEVGDCEDYTPLNRAATHNKWDIIRLLIKKGADIKTKARDECTPLHSAVLNRAKAAVETLLQKGAEIEARDNHGCTPLSLAASNGIQDVVELLLKHGASVSTQDTYSYGQCYGTGWQVSAPEVKRSGDYSVLEE
jgi:ankyrin repeat protein